MCDQYKFVRNEILFCCLDEDHEGDHYNASDDIYF